jgi:hypothetical protein
VARRAKPQQPRRHAARRVTAAAAPGRTWRTATARVSRRRRRRGTAHAGLAAGAAARAARAATDAPHARRPRAHHARVPRAAVAPRARLARAAVRSGRRKRAQGGVELLRWLADRWWIRGGPTTPQHERTFNATFHNRPCSTCQRCVRQRRVRAASWRHRWDCMAPTLHGAA